MSAICHSLRAVDGSINEHALMHEYALKRGLTCTFAAWHDTPEYRMFKTGSLLSRNDAYPAGLVLIDEKGEPHPWTPTP